MLGYMSLVIMSYSEPRAYTNRYLRCHHGVRLIAVLSGIEVWVIILSACAHCPKRRASGCHAWSRETPLRRGLRPLARSLEWELKITSCGGNTTAFTNSINESRQQQCQQTIVLTHPCQKSAQHNTEPMATHINAKRRTQNANAVKAMQ